MNFNEEEDLRANFKMRPSEYWKLKGLEYITCKLNFTINPTPPPRPLSLGDKIKL